MKTFADRLNAAMSAAGISQGQLAEKVGVSQPAIQKMTSGKTNGSRKMVELAHALNVRPEWLSSGVGPMHSDERRESSIPPENEWGKIDAWDSKTDLPDDEVEVPYLKDIELACGDGSCLEDDYNGFKLRFAKSTLRKVGAQQDSVLCFPASGNSMEPMIPEGTTVAINTNDKKIVDGKVYAISQDGWKRLKVLYRTSPSRIVIRSFNSEEYPDEEADIDRVEILGRMFWTSTIW
ncbi:helix-turn-helix transcriptional regulator [Citrobacter amalonaticus]|uniref:XRE family transcriptional regulator n=1 Tax=Citrobacter amalonaticus TaxID=35703 RepID=UPI001C9527D3|nr:helix-turn-helix transcriptional regulator [Citrobacter amalonaticus]MBY5256138.1 helix-turn-helix transcriptional regulator [Citrobacter amalonaticus]